MRSTATGSVPKSSVFASQTNSSFHAKGPLWYTARLGDRPFRAAMSDAIYREQYLDAVAALIRDQERAGLDVVTDGDSRFDPEVGGGSWAGYPAGHLSGTQGRTWDRGAQAPEAVGTIMGEIGQASSRPSLRRADSQAAGSDRRR